MKNFQIKWCSPTIVLTSPVFVRPLSLLLVATSLPRFRSFAPPPSCSYRPHCPHCRSLLIFLTECSAACNANASEHITEHTSHSPPTTISIPFTYYSFVCVAPFSDGDVRPDNLISFVDRTDCSHCTPSLLPFLSSVFAGSFCPPSFDCVSSCAGLLPRRRTLSR